MGGGSTAILVPEPREQDARATRFAVGLFHGRDARATRLPTTSLLTFRAGWVSIEISRSPKDPSGRMR